MVNKNFIFLIFKLLFKKITEKFNYLLVKFDNYYYLFILLIKDINIIKK